MRMRYRCILTLAIGIAWSAPSVVAQGARSAGQAPPSASAGQVASAIATGGRVFQNTCSNCHGPDGNEIAGIDLGRGQFRRPMTDSDLVQIIRTGIPGTAMPATNLSEEQAAQVVAYLRSTASAKPGPLATGDAVRGKAIYDGKGACARCHRVNGVGSRLGPDLSDIGTLRRAVDLERSLLDPDAEVLGTNRFYRVTTKDGVTTTGRLLNLDTFSVQMLDSNQRLRSFVKADLRDHGFAEESPMPSFKDALTARELGDVVRYLTSLKGRSNP